MNEYCQKALVSGVDCIYFTDHIDHNKNDYGYGYYNIENYFTELKQVQEKYAGKIVILSGIEFSEPHIYKSPFEVYKKYPYDFILGSVHFWLNDMFPSDMVKRNIPREVSFENYWNEVYKAISYGGFDSLAHIDFPKRYYKSSYYEDFQISNIFKLMIENDISLEINTSSLRKGLSVSMPDDDFLKLYKSVGGKYITYGSDSHITDDLAADYDYALNLIDSNGLAKVSYIQRHRIINT